MQFDWTASLEFVRRLWLLFSYYNSMWASSVGHWYACCSEVRSRQGWWASKGSWTESNCSRNMQEEYWSTHLQIIIFLSHLLLWLGRTLKSAQVSTMVFVWAQWDVIILSLIFHLQCDCTTSLSMSKQKSMRGENTTEMSGWCALVWPCFQLLHFVLRYHNLQLMAAVVQLWKHVVNLLWDITMMWTSTWIIW